MIDVAVGQALIDGMAGVTAEMAGQSMADAYNQRMTDTYEDASGVSIGVGNWTSDKPAISGNTNNTVISRLTPIQLMHGIIIRKILMTMLVILQVVRYLAL